jgi:hypothetical protein
MLLYLAKKPLGQVKRNWKEASMEALQLRLLILLTNMAAILVG